MVHKVAQSPRAKPKMQVKSDLNSIHLGHHVTDFIGIRSWQDKGLNHTGEKPPPRSGGKPPGPCRLLRSSTILLIMSVSFYPQWSTWHESLGGKNRAIPEEHNSGTCGLSTLWRASRQSNNDRKRCPKASRQSREESRACPRDSRGAGQQKMVLSARVLFWHHSQLLLWHLSNLTLTSLTSLLTPILTSTDFRLGFHSCTSYSWMRSLSLVYHLLLHNNTS